MPWESFIERRIREAMEAGQFENLPGAGKPIPGIDDPPDENWWIKQKLREEGISIVPPIVEARLAREKLLEELPHIPTEAELRARIEAVNKLIRDAIASPAPGPPISVATLDSNAVIAQWKLNTR
jgi:hypothetical protein